LKFALGAGGRSIQHDGVHGDRMGEVAASFELDPARMADPLFTLVETIEDLSLARTVYQIAAVIRSSARRITGADGVAFVMRDGDKCWYLDEDAIGPLWKGLKFPMSACISGWAMIHGRTVVIPDIYQDDRIPHDAYRPTFVKSLVVTPVRREAPIAAIGAYWSKTRQPTEDEVLKLEVMARAAATALESANVYAVLNETLERRKFLLRELDHRCKNLLASAQSIADQTLRRAPSPEHFVDAFTGRMAAMARAHELLTREEWGRADLADVIAAALAPIGGIDGVRISAEGPTVSLAPETSMSFHMAFHELAVNAIRHGALSTDAGRVEIRWSISEGAPETRRLGLVWREVGGAPPTSDRIGFGRRLLETMAGREVGGESRLTFEEDGARFTLTAPLSPRIAQG
jgi:two-component sensor histidine kinase